MAGAKGAVTFQLSLTNLSEAIQADPDVHRHVILAVLRRHQRVTLTALAEYLGLQHSTVFNFTGRAYAEQVGGGASIAVAAGSTAFHPRAGPEVRAQAVAELAEMIGCSSADLSPAWYAVYEAGAHVTNLGDPDWLLDKEGCRDTTVAPPRSRRAFGLVFVFRGALYQHRSSDDKTQSEQACDPNKSGARVGRGAVIGSLSVLTNAPWISTLTAIETSEVLVVPPEVMHRLVAGSLELLLKLSACCIQTITPLARQLDFTISQVHVEAGTLVYEQSNTPTTVTIVLSGRLRSVLNDPDGKRELGIEFGKGDVISDVEAFTEAPRASSIHGTIQTKLKSCVRRIKKGFFTHRVPPHLLIPDRLVICAPCPNRHRVHTHIHTTLTPHTHPRHLIRALSSRP